jgi:hypothetical protein
MHFQYLTITLGSVVLADHSCTSRWMANKRLGGLGPHVKIKTL